MEACTSGARGESKIMDADGTGFKGAEFTENSGVADTGATGTTGSRGVVERRLSEASGSKEVDNMEESGATGATGFCTRGSSTFGAAGIINFDSESFDSASRTTETGTAGFSATTPRGTFRAHAAGCPTEPPRAPRKRMPPKPTPEPRDFSLTKSLPCAT